MAKANALAKSDNKPAKYTEVIQHPVPERARFPEVSSFKKRSYLEALAMTGKITDSCIVAGVNVRTPTNWRLDEEFGKLHEKALSIYNSQDNDRLDRIMEARIENPAAPMSSVLLMFKKKAIDTRYRDNVPVQQAAVGNITVVFNVPKREYDRRDVIDATVVKELPEPDETS